VGDLVPRDRFSKQREFLAPVDKLVKEQRLCPGVVSEACTPGLGLLPVPNWRTRRVRHATLRAAPVVPTWSSMRSVTRSSPWAGPTSSARSAHIASTTSEAGVQSWAEAVELALKGQNERDATVGSPVGRAYKYKIGERGPNLAKVANFESFMMPATSSPRMGCGITDRSAAT